MAELDAIERNKLDVEYQKARLERLKATIKEYEAEIYLIEDNIAYLSRVNETLEIMEEDREDG